MSVQVQSSKHVVQADRVTVIRRMISQITMKKDKTPNDTERLKKLKDELKSLGGKTRESNYENVK